MNPQDTDFSLYRDVRVVRHSMPRVADPSAGLSEMPWQEYHTARNALVRVCRGHGRTGPMLECPITEGLDDPYGMAGWMRGDKNPDYYVVDEQANNERYLYIEVRRNGITDAWLSDVLKLLLRLPCWGIGVTDIKDGYLLLFPFIILVSGPCFNGCDDLRSVLRTWQMRALAE